MNPPHTFLAATDFGAASARAAEFASSLADAIGAELVLFHCCELPSTEETGLSSISEGERALARQELVTTREGLRARGEVRIRLGEGLPTKEILRNAKEVGAGLIVLGTHGRRGLRRLVLGSVAEHVVRSSLVPVVTVHEWIFEDRADAATMLAASARAVDGWDLVLTSSVGAAPIAADLAIALDALPSALAIESLTDAAGAPPLGAACELGVPWLDPALRGDEAGADSEKPAIEASRRARALGEAMRGGSPVLAVAGRSVVLVFDALEAVAPAFAGALALHAAGASRVAVAVPSCTQATIERLGSNGVDRVFCAVPTRLAAPPPACTATIGTSRRMM